MALTKADLEREVKAIYNQIVDTVYAGNETAWEAAGMNVTSDSEVNEDDLAVQAFATALEEKGTFGIEVSRGLLNKGNIASLQFVVGHEYGHAYSFDLLNKLDMKVSLRSVHPEVIADLASAWAMRQINGSWDKVNTAMGEWRQTEIFGEMLHSNHPPGHERVRYVQKLIRANPQDQREFERVAKSILKSIK